MKTSDFNYELPPELIAQTPIPQRDASRLLVLDKKYRSMAASAFLRPTGVSPARRLPDPQ